MEKGMGYFGRRWDEELGKETNEQSTSRGTKMMEKGL